MVIITRRNTKSATVTTDAKPATATEPKVELTQPMDDELTQPIPEPVTPEVDEPTQPIEVDATYEGPTQVDPPATNVDPPTNVDEPVAEPKAKAPKAPKAKLSAKCKYGYELFGAAALECLGDDKDSFLEQLEIVANYIKNGPNEPMTVKRLQTANPDWTHEQVEAEHQRQCDMWLDRYPAMEKPPATALARYKVTHPSAKADDFAKAEDRETYEAEALAAMKEYYSRHPEKKVPTKLKAKRPPTALALYKAANPPAKDADAKAVKAAFEGDENRGKYESEAFELLFQYHLEHPDLPKPAPVKNQLKNMMKAAPSQGDLTALKLFKAANPGEEWKEQGADITENYKALAKEAVEKFKVENAGYFADHPEMIPTPFKLFACKMQGKYIEVYGARYFAKMVRFWNKFVTNNLNDEMKASDEAKAAEACKKKAKSLYQFQYANQETSTVDEKGLPTCDANEDAEATNEDDTTDAEDTNEDNTTDNDE